MKFIGQFIQNLIARFRNDVYLEAVESGTIASGGNLGLDSNNKIVKAAEVGSSVDLTSEVTGVLPVSNGGTGNSTLTSNSILTGNGTSAVVAESLLTFTNDTLSILNGNNDKFEIAVGGVGDTTISTVDDGSSGDGTSADLLVDIDGDITLDSHTGAHYIKNNGTTFATFQNDIFRLDSSASSSPEIQLINSNTDANAPGLVFVKSATGADDDTLGRIQFIGDNESDAQHFYALIEGSIKDATANQESGMLEFKVADHDNTMTTGLKLDGDHSDGEVDVTIASGSTSTTTVSGNTVLTSGATILGNSYLLFFNSDNSNSTRVRSSTASTNRTIFFPDADGTLLLKDNVNPGKQFQVFQCNFIDDLNTSEVFIPIHGTTFEGAQVYQDDVAILAPCDGRIVSLDFKCISLTNNGDLTAKIYTLPPNTVGTSGGGTATTNWTEEESETISVTATDDNHVFHFAFDNAKHFESTEMFALSIQASADVMSNTFMYATVVVEFDYSTLLGSTSAEFDSVP